MKDGARFSWVCLAQEFESAGELGPEACTVDEDGGKECLSYCDQL